RPYLPEAKGFSSSLATGSSHDPPDAKLVIFPEMTSSLPSSNPMSRPLLIVDGDNLAHRAYHSTPKTVTGVSGSPINALVGFTSMLVNVWTKEQPRGVFVAWDTLGVDTYRSDEHAAWLL